MHRGPAASGNAFQQHFVRGRLGSGDALVGCGVDSNDVLHDWLPYSPLGGASLAKLIVSQRFGTSARKGENGFMPGRIVSSRRLRRNIREGKSSNLNPMGF
jgi:hypothetical protein